MGVVHLKCAAAWGGRGWRPCCSCTRLLVGWGGLAWSSSSCAVRLCSWPCDGPCVGSCVSNVWQRLLPQDKQKPLPPTAMNTPTPHSNEHSYPPRS